MGAPEGASEAYVLDYPQSLHDLTNHPAWDAFRGDKLGNDLFINDPDRAERVYAAASEGADGSTHAEAIEDMREFADQLYDEEHRKLWGSDATEEQEGALEAARDQIHAELDEVERWHEQNGSLYTEIG